MPELLIRQVTTRDLDACFAIEAACYGREGATRERIAHRIATYPDGFLVAELDARVAGFVNSGATQRNDIADEALKDLVGHDPSGANIVIFSLAVAPPFQRQGIGKALLRQFIVTAQRLAKAQILLLCLTELIPYYAQFGFAHRGISASAHGGLHWHELALQLGR
jgi:ribosomal protein S18 acetylase RimI-like enzyme